MDAASSDIARASGGLPGEALVPRPFRTFGEDIKPAATTGVVALGTEDACCLGLKALALISAAGRRKLIDHEHRVFGKEGQPLQ